MENNVASIIMAAGRGSRMQGYTGNKTLLPLEPTNEPFVGKRPILINIIQNLPQGPKAIVVHHKKEDIIKAVGNLKDISFCHQEVLNGTGGALLAAKNFVVNTHCHSFVVTMGDVPLVHPTTYEKLIEGLYNASMVVLAFRPVSKRQYGVLKVSGEHVIEIIEWKYWSNMPLEEQKKLELCNSGIYAMKKTDLLEDLPLLEKNPHLVEKEIDGKRVQFHEFFITDLVTIMNNRGKKVGYIIAEEEHEVMGVDDLESLLLAQKIFSYSKSKNSLR